jgi:hypothetical protein
VRSDGITVPLTHNHCCGPSTWATGTGAVDIPGGQLHGDFLLRPARWNGPGGLPRFRDDFIFTPEFQGGSFDPGRAWLRRVPTTHRPRLKVLQEQHRRRRDDAGFYMTYGGRRGWLPDPGQVTRPTTTGRP